MICSAYEFADGDGVDGPARNDLNAEQKSWIEKLRTLFPRGFVFGTPACDADAPFFEPRRQHIVFSHINIEYVWDALYEHFELPEDESPDDAQCHGIETDSARGESSPGPEKEHRG